MYLAQIWSYIMKVVFIHGWSVTSTETYGELPKVLEREAPAGLNIEIDSIYLGEYISFHDEVILEDISRAFERARREKFGDEQFVCITHSTGAPVIRLWLDLFFKNILTSSPITHLIMLAPANHGSALAILGKSRLGRIKAWIEGMEPGVGILKWLQLGSDNQWDLNHSWLSYQYGIDTIFPFVLSGEKIDTHYYDFLNDYLVEKGSDGVVRLAGANMNYIMFKLVQNCNVEPFDALIDSRTIKAYPLKLDGEILRSPKSAFEVIPNASHTGDKYGIMASVKRSRTVKQIIPSIIEALAVDSWISYEQCINDMQERSEVVQNNSHRYVMLIFNISDNYGNPVEDFDMLLLAGEEYRPGKLPRGFFIDKQKNEMSGNLIYYLDYDKMAEIEDGKFGIRIVARPNEGFSHYAVAEFHSNSIDIEAFIQPNQTVMVDIVLTRRISVNTVMLDTVNEAEKDFKDREPSNEKID